MPQVKITAAHGLVQESGTGDLLVEGLAGAGRLAPTAAPDSASGNTAISIATTRTVWTTGTPGVTGTLANGTAPGQIKSVGAVIASEFLSGSLEPANLADGTSIKFDDGRGLEWSGVWDGTQWRTIQADMLTID